MVIPIQTQEGVEALGDDDFAEPDFIDEPLDPVAQDNIDIDVIIGQHEPEVLEVGDTPSEGKPYFVTDLEVHLTDGIESNYAKGNIVPDDHNRMPDEGNPLQRGDPPDLITIDVDNELTSDIRSSNSFARDELQADGEITRIFTGVISNASRIETGRFEFMAFWPGFNEIQNGSTVISLPPPEYESYTHNGRTYKYPVYDDRWQDSSNVADDIASDIVRGEKFDYTINLTKEGTQIGDTKAGVDQRVHIDSTYVPITADPPNTGALTRIVNATNSVWDIDRYGNFHIGPPTPDGDNPTAVNAHKLRYFTDTSAGRQSPAWRSVVVIGDNVVSQDGWGANAQINENPEKFSDPVTEKFAPDPGDISSNLAEPVFEYTNLEINTAEEAENVLGKIKDEIREQMGNGEVSVVGHPEVWPGDAVEFPDSENQPFGLERFHVGKVIHRFNNQEGYMTTIEVAGQTNANETTFADEVEPPDDNERYDPRPP